MKISFIKMDNSKSLISIVFPSYNGAYYIKKNLESLQKISNLDEIEIVIVDNNSEDSTKEIIKSFKNLNIKLIELKDNYGFPKACNLGAINASGKYLFITNQDMVFPKDFFIVLLQSDSIKGEFT